MATKEKNIHWFPGHMKKALNEITERIKIVDVVIEVLDARIPLSSLNKEVDSLLQNKPTLFVYSKADLADPEEVKKIKQSNVHAVFGNLYEKMTVESIKKEVAILAKEKNERDIRRGLKPQPVKVMILGIPNVGKSTLINRFANKNSMGVQNKPGYTKSEKWIHISNDFYLLDTPGVLEAKYENQEKATKLALIGSIREDILPLYDLADSLIDILNSLYGKDFLKQKYDIFYEFDKEKIYEEIAKKRGYLKAGEYDKDKAMVTLLKDYRDGLLGKYNLERI